MFKKFPVALGIVCALFPVLAARAHASAADIVLTAVNAVDVHGHWSRRPDTSAAGGVMLTSPDSGWQNTAGALAAPAHYVDFTFTPQPGVAYRVWLRLRAAGGSKYNDSVFVQFSNARDSKNIARYRLGTAESLLVNRQRCNGCGQNAWGWYDGAYWLSQPSVLTFTEGSQTLRVQTREDGVEIDQIVLSPASYLTAAPGASDYDTALVAGVQSPTSVAYAGSAILVPATIAADAFDDGGAGVAYHDTTIGSDGGGTRSGHVDLMPLAGGGFAISAIDAGEWLNYTINVPFGGEYQLEADVASAVSGGKFHVDVNGDNLTGVLTIPNTGSATQFTTVAQPVVLSAGTHTMKIVFDTRAPHTALANLRLTRPRSPYGNASQSIPGTVPAEQFDNGGQGWSWFDSTAGNAGGQARATDVDIFGGATSGYYIAGTVAGEWLEYTVNVTSPGEYLMAFEVASAGDGGRLSARLGDVSTGPVAVPNTGSLTTWTTVSAAVRLAAGEQVLRIGIDSGGLSLRRIHVHAAPSYTTFEVPAGGDLQSAIEAAQPGDVILLAPGATYIGNFKLPFKSDARNDGAYITIRSAAPDALLPGDDVRMTPDFAPLLPKLRSPNNEPALATEPYAHHYHIKFVEFLANVKGQGNIISLGDGSTAQNTLAMVPHHLVLDRVYVHGDVTWGQKRGIALNSAETTIVNSYIAEIKAAGMDSQAIGGWNGPGPYLISNNYLEAAGENVMFGGADPAIPELVPSDITFTRNHLYKPMSWRGSVWTIKNLFELKSAQRVLIDSNLMENNWLAAQTGYAVLLKSVNQDGGAPWSVVQDVTFTNNIVRHVASAVNILGSDWRYPAIEANNIVIRNNLFDDVSAAKYGGSGRFLQISGGVDVVIDHNTVVADGATVVMADGSPTDSFQFTNNVVKHNAYGIKGSGTAIGNGTIATYFPNGVFEGGIYIGGKPWLYPAGNHFPSTVADVAFMDYSGGDYRLAPHSVYRGAGTSGTDPGVDYATLAGVSTSAK